jgi:UrcA family protein
VAIALAVVLAPMGANAHAERDRETVRVAVAFGDLDLSRPEDARVMAKRIDKAAARACGGDPRLGPGPWLAASWAVEAFEECHRDAVRAAVAQLGAPRVAEAYAAGSAGMGGAP